jgi:hypothetical protein
VSRHRGGTCGHPLGERLAPVAAIRTVQTPPQLQACLPPWPRRLRGGTSYAWSPARRFIALVQSGRPGMSACVPGLPLVRAWRRMRGRRPVRPSAVPIPADVTVWTGAPPGELRLLRQTNDVAL